MAMLLFSPRWMILPTHAHFAAVSASPSYFIRLIGWGPKLKPDRFGDGDESTRRWQR